MVTTVSLRSRRATVWTLPATSAITSASATGSRVNGSVPASAVERAKRSSTRWLRLSVSRSTIAR